MKKLLAFLLVAVLAVTCLTLTLSVSAEGASVTAVATKSEVVFDEAKLAKLVDGDLDLGATAFGSAGLISFQNPTFRDGNATVEITVDLGETKTIGSVNLYFFRDDNDTTGSFISMPSALEVAVSADGEDYHDVNGGNAIAIPEGVDLKVNTVTVDFSDSVESDVRYIKATVTFDNEWIFMSEISVDEAEEGDNNSTETSDETENTESTETTDDVENTESTETTDDVESTESTESADSTESTESASTDAPVPSDAGSSSTSPETGDSGFILFAVLGVVALAGAAVVVKARG